MFYLGRKEESKKTFERAQALFETAPVGRQDKREMGRILVNSMVVYLSNNELEEAETRLAKCLELNRQFGDRRRAASARGFEAILLHKQGRELEARDVMLDAIEQHHKVDSWRELANEVPTYLWMIDPRFDGDLSRTEEMTSLPEQVRSCVDHFLRTEELGVFLAFWKERFKPLVLDGGVPSAGHPKPVPKKQNIKPRRKNQTRTPPARG